jgi:pimeloyl-ACP methyl ester carboxylesterase
VLIPGWTEQLSFFEYLTAGLTDAGLRVVAYDLRGQGHSARPRDADYRTERYGEDLEAVLSAAADGRTDVTVAGHSLGGMSIAAWAADHDVARRARAAALINTGMDGLISSSTLIPVVLPALVHGTVARRAFLGNPLPVPPVSTALSRSAIRYIAFGPRATPAQIVFFERMLVQCPVEVRVGAGVAMAELDLLSALERLTLPTLVISGDLDRLTPASHGARMAQALPDSAGLIVLPRTGHMAPLECPELLLGPLTELACGDTVAMAQTATSQVG